MASGSNLSPSQIQRGLHIYMGGVGLQQLFILLFIYLASRFQKEMKRDLPPSSHPRVLRLLYTLYGALALITIRIIFRLIEYAQGIDSGIPRKEAYQYVFDSSMMLCALVLLNVVHPGRIMPGREYDFPGRKERKAKGKNGIRGRAGLGGELPMYETAPVNGEGELEGRNPTFPKIDGATVSQGHVTEYGW